MGYNIYVVNNTAGISCSILYSAPADKKQTDSYQNIYKFIPGGNMLIPFDEKDIILCARFFEDVYTAPPWNCDWVDEEGAYSYLRDIYLTPGFVGFLYSDDSILPGEPIGFCVGCVQGYFNAPAAYEIKEIMVAPAFQKQGIGTKMLNEVEHALTKQGVELIMLHTDKTIPAYKMYTKNGYISNERNVNMSKVI